MHLQPGGRQGHIPDMSWLNKAIYQHRVDTAELGTESQRALAPGPRNTQRARGDLRAGKVSPASAPRQKPHGHCCAHSGETTRVPPRLQGLLRELLPTRRSSAGIAGRGLTTAGAEPRGAVSPMEAPMPRDTSGSGRAGSEHSPAGTPGPQHPSPRGSFSPGPAPSIGAALRAAGLGFRGSIRGPGVAQSSLESTSPRRDVRHPELRDRGYGRSLPSSLPSPPRTCRGWARGGARTHLGTGGDRVRRARRKL